MTHLIHDLTAADTAEPALSAAFGPGLGVFSRSGAPIDLAQLPFAHSVLPPLPTPASSRPLRRMERDAASELVR